MARFFLSKGKTFNRTNPSNSLSLCATVNDVLQSVPDAAIGIRLGVRRDDGLVVTVDIQRGYIIAESIKLILTTLECATISSVMESQRLTTMSHFVGCWRFIWAENLDELLKTLKVNEGLRKMATVARPRVIIRMVSVRELEVASITDCNTVVEQAKFDEEFTEFTADGRVVTSTFTKESESKMTKVQRHADLNTIVQYEVQGDELMT
ncbi:uncharacterized protein DEA37_0007240, partial [Paragonimus westermani]